MEHTNSTNKGMMDEEQTNQPLQKAAEVAAEMKQEVGKYVDNAKEYWDEFSDEFRAKSKIAREGITKAKKYADDVVHENPWRAIGLAAIIGAVAGLVISSCHKHQRGCRHDHE